MGVYGRRIRSEVIDVYDVLTAFDVRSAPVQHAIKKLLCTGIRGYKDRATDLEEARQAIVRAIEIEAEYAEQATKNKPHGA